MKRNLFNILAVTAILALMTSCNKFDPLEAFGPWKTRNDTYFATYKDSTSYVLNTIPASSGGGSYYYKIKVQGDPASVSPTANDQISVNYRGKMIDGTVFDQTFEGVALPDDGTAITKSFYVKGLIRGWQENMLQMKVGEIRTIVLPQELGYGSVGASPSVAPYSVTLWEVQLVKIL